ncbi:MAG: methionine--tRNA ligase [bacterium]|nr:methionine--tRNA ligase [bacterium]MDZ4284547.1 methionine--tRNA ligase [Patescibacteria group bacterium]
MQKRLTGSTARYLTTTLPYVNADPHIGFAFEIVHADIAARYHTLAGDDVFFNTGTDEHGQKIFEKARAAGKDPQAYVDEYAEKFRRLKGALGLSADIHFIRTTEPRHRAAAQEFWRRCEARGDIYKKLYQMKYCVGCELEKTDSELEKGRCPLHPAQELETREEENYFFRFSKYRQPLLDFYERCPDFVVPDFRFNEIKRFIERGLEDFSISRLATKMPWGVAIPGDESQVMFVWFDALVNYVSTLGWPEDIAQFEKYWGRPEAPRAVQFAGKDNLRQQSAMWQAMLLSAGLPLSRQIVIHGFITSGGQKMSKSLGNVINPYDIVEGYGVDALRYYLARHIHPFEDSDFTMEKFTDAYNANLANGLGNFVARVMALVAKSKIKNQKSKLQFKSQKLRTVLDTATQSYHAAFGAYHIQNVADAVWKLIQAGDEHVQETRPWEGEKQDVLEDLTALLGEIATLLVPILPETAGKIKSALETCTMPAPLFPRE